MSKSSAIATDERTRLFSARFLISLLLIVVGIGWLYLLPQMQGAGLALQHVEDADTQLGRRRQDRVLARALAIADAGEQVTHGIGHCHF